MAEMMSQHGEWLSLIEVSGPFLAEPVLKEAFPAGLQKLESTKKKQFRQTYEEWRESVDSSDELQSELHQQWIDWVLKQGLEWDEDNEGEELKTGDQIPADIQLDLPEHQLSIKPTYVLYGSDKDIPYLLVSHYSADTNLNDVFAGDGWSTSPAERMSHLCRNVGTRLGLVTNGEQWMFVDAPEGGITSYASWYARLWSQEPITLIAFHELLNIRTVFNGFGLDAVKLTDLLDESIKHQDEVTETLGAQVQRAVEVLVQSLDRINNDSNGELLDGIEPPELYEAGLTFMMRLVFLLCAEERGLLLLDDETYTANYALSTLRMKLREEAGLHGEEVLSYRTNAWSRLLALFRAVYGGIDHESLRMPALGGSLFDPDRFPFLEGRSKDSSWKTEEARPLPIDNRTVLLFLDAIQLFQGRTLSYRALDVEQIGYVYEGLLERTVIRAEDVTLELDSTQKSKKPWILLGELASAELDGDVAIRRLLAERTGSSASRVKNDLVKEVNETDSETLLLACLNDGSLRDRVKPYAHFLKKDAWGNPMIYPRGAFMVSTGSDRRETGTHYTPKSLTEAIVQETLEPIVYAGPPDGRERTNWQLKSPDELLALKICDPAMGSGAFLVQVCRYLSERLCEAWVLAEEAGLSISNAGKLVDEPSGDDSLPRDTEERKVLARRLVAEHCLYGVDVNPLAVELAKLAIWLVTLSKGRPFGFLDHNLKAGNSLLGIHDLDQLYYLSMQPEGMSAGGGSGKQLFAQGIESAVEAALRLREELRNRTVRDIRDVEVMAHLNEQAQALLCMPELIADALIGEALVSATKPASLKSSLTRLSVVAGNLLAAESSGDEYIRNHAKQLLAVDLESGQPRKPLHWPLVFPEVFNPFSGGFDAIVGNVPFLGGKKLSGAMGKAFRDYMLAYLASGKRGNADLAAYFFLQAYRLLRKDGVFGLVATNTIAEGDTRQIGLESLLGEHDATIYAAYSNEPWPGKAAVVTSRVHTRRGCWGGLVKLNGEVVPYVSAFLSSRKDWSLKSLKSNSNKVFQGTITLGSGFELTESEAVTIIAQDSANQQVLFPYINGKEINTDPEQRPGRWIINFFDWPEERAKKYTKSFQVLEERVKPERLAKKDKNVRKYPWWQYWRPRAALYHAIGRGKDYVKHPKNWDSNQLPPEQVLVNSLVTKYFAPSIVKNTAVFSHKIAVFSDGSYYNLAILNSSLIQAWVVKHSSSQGVGGLNFSPSDSYVTLAYPKVNASQSEEIETLGKAYHELRRAIMLDAKIGLTKLYNRFHNSEDEEMAILEMRDLHRRIDESVCLAYGWNDLALDHDYYEIDYLPKNDRIRFTISEPARNSVLDRLGELNQERFDEEQLGVGIMQLNPTEKYKDSIEDELLSKVAEPKPQIDIFGKEE